MVGDYRDKAGFYSNFVGETTAAFEAVGAHLYNEAILVTAAGSLPIRAGKQFASTRKLGKTHQNVLVFCKGDPRKATAASQLRLRRRKAGGISYAACLALSATSARSR